MKGKRSELPVATNFRIADHDEDAVKHDGPGAINGDATATHANAAPGSGHGTLPAGSKAQVQAVGTDETKPDDSKIAGSGADTAAVAQQTDTAPAAETPTAADAAATAAAGDEGGDADHEDDGETGLEGDAADIAYSNEQFEPRVTKVAADGGAAIVKWLKGHMFFGDTWRKFDEIQQRGAIDGCYDLARTITRGSVNAVASRGFDYVEMSLSSVKISLKDDGTRKCEVAGTIPYDKHFVIDSVDNKSVMMVPRNYMQFEGEEKVKPTVIGTLKLPDPNNPELPLGPPISGPGTPTPAVVMDAVGKGPVAAAAAEASIKTGPQPTVHG